MIRLKCPYHFVVDWDERKVYRTSSTRKLQKIVRELKKAGHEFTVLPKGMWRAGTYIWEVVEHERVQEYIDETV